MQFLVVFALAVVAFAAAKSDSEHAADLIRAVDQCKLRARLNLVRVSSASLTSAAKDCTTERFINDMFGDFFGTSKPEPIPIDCLSKAAGVEIKPKINRADAAAIRCYTQKVNPRN